VIQVGSKINGLTVLRLVMGTKGTHPMAHCMCECGKTTWFRQTDLRRSLKTNCVSCVRSNAWVGRERAKPHEKFLCIKESEYKCNARSRKIHWHLDRSTFRQLFESACVYCGLKPANGIDRFDNNKGYNLKNAKPCCSQCNFAKRMQTADEFYEWIDRLTSFRSQNHA
jgi:hypothetical protein